MTSHKDYVSFEWRHVRGRRPYKKILSVKNVAIGPSYEENKICFVRFFITHPLLIYVFGTQNNIFNKKRKGNMKVNKINN